ncbi:MULTISPECIES: hypothetical protein [unclassified Parabacteroides]|uniref:hypothetical protein n=1 Tax=unclassified Parabacteroides TaxID=2649774 RepID=UPI0024747D9A|nr:MULTISPECIES: hypothetical protein [unclassified Parabacteroides]
MHLIIGAIIGGVVNWAATGAASGFSGGVVSGSGNSWLAGSDFGQGLLEGLKIGGIGALTGGVTGGIVGGIDALTKGTDFWTGNATFDLSDAYGATGTAIGDKTITGKYVGDYEGINLYESSMMVDNSAATLPGRGIILSKGLYTSNPNSLSVKELLQHEFGHILQAREVGLKAYYRIIAPESLASAAIDGVGGWNHNNFWTETWANYLSNNYFGSNSLLVNNPIRWPAKNINWYNSLRVWAVNFYMVF